MSVYISETREPEHVMPFHGWHGSPPLDVQPVSCDGKLRLVNKLFKTETARRRNKHEANDDDDCYN